MDKKQQQLNDLFAISAKFRNMMLKYRPSKAVSTGEQHMMKVIDWYVSETKKKTGQCSGITPTQLSTYLMISRPAISRMLSILEEKNYIARISKGKDKRAVSICLTSLGEKILQEADGSIEKVMKSIVEEMGEEEMDLFIKSSDKIYTILNRKLAGEMKN